MDTKNKKKLDDFSDRHLLELIFTTVIIMNRKIERIEKHLEALDDEYLSRFGESIEDTISKVIDEHADMESDIIRILNKSH